MAEVTYQEETKNNEDQFKAMVKSVRPDIFALMDIIDQTGVNSFVLWRVAYALNNIAMSTNYGNVVIEIENGTVRFVRGQSADKISEPLIKKAREELGYIKNDTNV